MGLFSKFVPWPRRGASALKQRAARNDANVLRHCTFESMEPRRMLSANPLVLGTVYIEEDLGSDLHGDRFEVSFAGGATGTELTRLIINGDRGTPGFGMGDVFFDTLPTGLGADNAAAFRVEQLISNNPNARVEAHVSDGDTLLVIDFYGFQAGDKLVFSIDVDEVEYFDPAETNLDRINEGFDPITSGVEFQGSTLTAHFSAQHYKDAEGTTTFWNRYDDALRASGLDLPEDNIDGKRDRTTGAFMDVQQVVDPASITGYVYADYSNDGSRDAGEPGLGGVTVRVIPVDTLAPQETVIVRTNASGFYEATNLSPGTYRLVEVDQPGGYLDGLDTAGTVNGVPRGSAVNPGENIEDIFLGGGTRGIEYNFGEILPASIEGSVRLTDRDGHCSGDGVIAPPLSGVTIRLLDGQGRMIAETSTDLQGAYAFTGLAPGLYSVLETTPDGLIDAAARAGTVEGQVRGSAMDANSIVNVNLHAGDRGREYDFCEHLPSTISGNVYHDRNDNGQRESGEEAIAGVRVTLYDQDANKLAVTHTDTAGHYQFSGLSAGSYRIVETQPSGWLDGKDTAGRVDGVASGSVTSNDTIRNAVLRWGSTGVNYNFGELLPGSIQGVVHADADRDCIFDPNEQPIAGVKIELLDDRGGVIAVTHTDDGGEYRFEGLTPGTYAVRETQPDGYYQGSQTAGSHGGDASTADLISQIPVGSDQHLTHYDFCEVEPGSISGIVFVDPNQNEVYDAGEQLLRGVTVQLLDATGRVVGMTQTNEAGYYEFTNLRPGTYGVHELQPPGYFQGGQQAGSRGGNAATDDYITSAVIGAGEDLTQYNFSEIPPSSLSGIVYVDPNQNEVYESGETLLTGVTVQLLDAQGRVVATTETNEVGYYEFTNLRPGTYGVHELQPADYYQGGQQTGSRGGNAAIDDYITAIAIGAGEQLTQYNFSEIPPSSIAGLVYVATGTNCAINPDRPLAGVTVELISSRGEVVGTTRTDRAGRYQFDELAPGEYSVREAQPAGYFQGGQCAGTGGGDDQARDLISDIQIGAGVHLVNYNFYELPPASISGYVFQDGPALQTIDGQAPERLSDFRDGRRTTDDRPIAGVVLELRNGLTGEAITADQALPGAYGSGPLTAVTDAQGYYVFHSLPRGSYAVYEIHPAQYIDGIDTAGTTSGVTFNIDSPSLQVIIQRLVKDPDGDAIVQIPLAVGQVSRENNFSEVLVERITAPPLPPLPAPPTWTPQLIVTPPGVPLSLTPFDFPRAIASLPEYGAGGDLKMSWHLSVVDGGTPRGDNPDMNLAVTQWRSVSFLNHTQWISVALNQGQWTLPPELASATMDAQGGIVFGIPDAIPISGDFNGDGISEIGLYKEGNWFIDLNGNGRWDEEDLWARLGTAEDLPVVGDWDGDGKDDIGIFGPEWRGDERAIGAEPGLPDPQNNFRRSQVETGATPKNLPPEPAEATDGHRVLKRTASGDPRLDVIDHVFRFGVAKDLPVAGDWNGDGIRSIGVFHAGTWYLDMDGDGRHTDRDVVATYGTDGDLPVVGDFNGDGIEEIGIYRRGMWYLDTNGNREMDAHDQVFRMGDADDKPVVGDWDGDGRDDPALYRDAG